MVCFFPIDRGLPETEDSFPAGEVRVGQDAHFGRCVKMATLLNPVLTVCSPPQHPHFFFPFLSLTFL